MNCANHPETPAAAYCRECGKPLCPDCIRRAQGSVFCAEHAPKAPEPAFTPPVGTAAGFAPSPPASAWDIPGASTPPEPQAAALDSPYAAPVAAIPAQVHATPGVPPVIALLLGFIPGVGAICNGQYAKGLIHAVIFGLLVSIVSTSHRQPIEIIGGITIAAWVFYMAFEAFHTAYRRRRGLRVEEFSSLFDVRGSSNRVPLGAILLVVVGFILLLDTTDIISMEVFARYWPAGLIALGIYLLYARVHPSHPVNDSESDLEVRR